MPSTIETNEHFPNITEENRLKDEVKLRIKAGAIRSWYKKEMEFWILYTEWNIIGE